MGLFRVVAGVWGAAGRHVTGDGRRVCEQRCRPCLLAAWLFNALPVHQSDCCTAGFCYINDIVLAILELLKVHHR
jgi:hypothetical protein